MIPMTKKDREVALNLALAAGLRDVSYGTYNSGWVTEYRGEVNIVMPDGIRYMACGFRPEGTPEVVTRQGGVTFLRLP